MSVLLPVYNAQPYLAEAVESVLGQTFTDIEVLLVDDGSTDNSGAICDAFAAQDVRVRVLRHPGKANRGLVASLNLALAEARGEFIARMDADDVSYPERFERKVAFLDAHPEVGVVGCRADSFDGHDWSVWGENTQSAELIRWYVLFTAPMPGAFLMLRRHLAEQVGGFDARAEYAEDYQFLLDLSRVTTIRSLPDRLYYYRRDVSSSICRVHGTLQYEIRRAIQRDAQRDYGVAPLTPEARAFLFPLSVEETESFGHFGLSEARDSVKAMHDLRRAFVRRWSPSRESRRAIDEHVRFHVVQLTASLCQRSLVSAPHAKWLRLVWNPRGTVAHTLARLRARLSTPAVSVPC